MRKIAKHPYLEAGALSFVSQKLHSDIPCVIDKGIVYSTINASSALDIGISCLGLQPGEEVLIPAYHCPVMVYPVMKAGGRPIFYQMNHDCSVNMADLERKVTRQTRAIIVVHYYGFPNRITEIKSICSVKKIYLIEDCAHTFYGYCDGLPVGSFGDFSISSLWKFFPVYHGGFLKFENQELARGVCISHPSLFFQLKSVLNTLEMGSDIENGSSLRRAIFRMKDGAWTVLKSLFGKLSQTMDAAAASSDPYSCELIAGTYSHHKMPLFSDFLYKLTDKEQLITRRRTNFEFLLKEFEQIPGVRPLFKDLPPSVVPYVFPLISEHADMLANALRKNGVDIMRFGKLLWEGMDQTTCPVTSFYSKHCIQLPVHQCLTAEDMRYMIEIIFDEIGSKFSKHSG